MSPGRRIVGDLAGLAMVLVAALALVTPDRAFAQERLSVWWVRGFHKSEDDALNAAIRKFEEKTGVKVDVTQYSAQDMNPKTVATLEAGSPPDVAYSDFYDSQYTARWAFEGRLEDISDIIVPMRDRFLKQTIETTYLYNDKTKKKAYYAFPIKQQTVHIQYWKDMLAEAGFRESDVPKGWKAYWDFWCDKVQSAYRKKTSKGVFGIGQPMGVDSSDSYYAFFLFMDAYNVKLVDDNGRLLIGPPSREPSSHAGGRTQVRETNANEKSRSGLISALRDYTGIRTRGCTPAASMSWKDPDNNSAFQDKAIVTTTDRWFADANNATLSAEQRAQARKDYDEQVVTMGFPNKPDGSKMSYRAAVKTGVIFEAAKNKKRAKEFVQFMLQDENLTPYVEGGLGRWFPVTKSGAASAFWQADSHRRTVFNQFASGTVTFEFTRNYKFTALNNENVWAKAMSRVVNDNVPVDKAVDEMIARIVQVAGS